MSNAYKPRIMYIERKAGNLTGEARIGRVTFSRTGATLYYAGREFQRIQGFKANYIELGPGEEFWISGPKKDGSDSLYATNIRPDIDEDAREEYWLSIRNRPERVKETKA